MYCVFWATGAIFYKVEIFGVMLWFTVNVLNKCRGYTRKGKHMSIFRLKGLFTLFTKESIEWLVSANTYPLPCHPSTSSERGVHCLETRVVFSENFVNKSRQSYYKEIKSFLWNSLLGIRYKRLKHFWLKVKR